MAVAFTVIRDSVAEKLTRSGTVAQGYIDEQIQAAVRYCRRQPWHFTEEREGTLTTVANQDWYTTVTFDATSVPVEDILRIDEIRSPDNLDRCLDLISYNEYQNLQRGTTVTSLSPTAYTRYGQQIGIYSTPGGVFNLEVSAVVKPEVPATSATTSVFFEQARDLIEAYACEKTCALYFRNMEHAAAFRDERMSQERALNQEHALQTATRRTTARY